MSGYSGTFGGPAPLDYWRLADELSVVDAAILITGNDPSYETEDNEGVWHQRTNYEGYSAAYKALRAAILGNKLRATVKLSTRGSATAWSPDGQPYEVVEMPHEEQISYDMLVARIDTYGKKPKEAPGQTITNFSVDELRNSSFLYICKEPNWKETLVSVEDLKAWLASKGFYASFFFPKGRVDTFQNKEHPRYSAKLAACVAAWEAVTGPAKNSSVKKTVKDWLQSNASRYGVGDDNGIVSPTAAEELAKIVNWNPSGGANPTSGSIEHQSARDDGPIENYKYGYSEHPKYGDIDDTEISF
ncbi:hypothetical protein PhaeoP30_00763 [Phaeobacter inhibens]|uniref:hypothetical protein n=1 Tax=Phaeobacter inhibens TaxID=221822 RepID=UPI000C9BD1BC|nr:hypothetical protein [Phaeobacter inhibens]AUQ57704.1 hypothetical protein PhaeoP30_00763 [Phaeobacter inhibens]